MSKAGVTTALENYVPEPNTGCWLWLGGTNQYGYGVCHKRLTGQQLAHRFFYATFVGPIPPKQLVCHRCDTRLCVNPDHMFLGSHRDNTIDMVQKGRHGRGLRVTAFGQTMTIKEWAALANTQPKAIHARLRRGLTNEEAVAPGDGRFLRGPLKRRRMDRFLRGGGDAEHC